MSVGKKLNKKDLLSTNLATKKGYCTQRCLNKTRIMDTELREILNKVYKQEMRPDEAQWKICVLFNVVWQSEQLNCEHPIKQRKKNDFTGIEYCGVCNKNT